ncbi:molybdopterin cofactor-binding domain-containing protein [Litorimonas sp. WD9-15]|uniref:xanthine dehydrogenase family protein molybdopterin-binding subunit n=1 Tax=Litorimonas sp. WD9-15 TaxID=3418716 RepID=UPI003D058EDB
MGTVFNPSRRGVLAGSGALVLGLALPLKGKKVLAQTSGNPFAPNAFIRIAPDNTVTILSKHIEFGQGPWTGLATLVAEELDADWDQMRVEHAPADVTKYANVLFGVQGTGGSTAMASSYTQMRQAGATARAMLVQAAAEKWGMKPSAITVSDGIVRGSSNSATFGELAEAASKIEPPVEPTLKAKKDFKFIGTDRPKIDSLRKSTGTAEFTIDLYRPNMLVAVAAHPPAFGGTLASMDDREARNVKGVVDIVTVPQGVAVLAENTFAALKARDKLVLNWSDDGAETRDSAALRQLFVDAARTDGIEAAKTGDAAVALAAAEEDGTFIHEAEFYFPFLAHATMEPLDAVLERAEDGSVDVWMGSQIQTIDHGTLAAVLGMDQSNIRLNTMLAGGSFGRLATPTAHFAAEAAAIFKASGMDRPVKFMWTRTNDIKGGYYRPIATHKVRAAMDRSGDILGWEQTVASQSLTKGTPFDTGAEVDATMIEGIKEPYYEMPDHRLTAHMVDIGVPPLWWRSVGHTHTAYVMETMIDEMLEKQGLHPVSGRMRLLKDPREKAVLARVAEMANFNRKMNPERKLGVAVHKSFGTYCAQVAEVSMKNGKPKVHKVWCAVDCGQPINPNVIRAQIEGGIGYGLGAVLFDEITLGQGGKVDQSNFHDYRSLRIHEMPQIEVAIIDSDENPTGIGEPGTPPIGPAIANALRRLDGTRHHSLPIIGLNDPVGV